MKTTNEIINQEPVYLNHWSCREDVIKDFCGYDQNPSDEWNDVNFLFASYGQDNYSGDAFVLFERDGELFEVHGSHCSCYGLEDQFDPESVVLEELENRLKNGDFGKDDYSGNAFHQELVSFLGI